jgi:hypothetical protein
LRARRVPGWFSTEDADTLEHDRLFGYPNMQGAGFDVVYSSYPGGHFVSPAESSDVVAWWLGPA